jgi:hypothetical protein
MSSLGSLNTLWTKDFGKVDPLSTFAMIGEHRQDEDAVSARKTRSFCFRNYTVVVARRRVHNNCV